MSKLGLTISFDLKNEEDQDILFQIERLFQKIGITFDTGMGEKRDWEWDWSLKGPVEVHVHGSINDPEDEDDESDI